MVIGLLQIRQKYSFLSLGLWPCSLSRFLHAVLCDVGPEGSAPNDKPEEPQQMTRPGADNKLDRFDISCVLVPVEAVGEPSSILPLPYSCLTCCVCCLRETEG